MIVDDGRTTRIKQLKGTGPGGASGHLDNLIEVDTSSAPARSTDFALGAFSQITVSCIDSAGAATPPTGAGPTTFPIAMALTHTFKIHSGEHRLEGRIVDRSGGPSPAGSNRDCQLTISGVNGTEPIVEARANKGQRRYIISNAPPIERVDINAAGAPQSFTVPGGTVYTVVILK